MKNNVWEGCYNDNWTGDITPEAFSHPAKFSRGLINRIYQHAKEMGWVVPGDVVIDPFGGVGLGGLGAICMGLNWIGVELEPKFVSLGEQNIELWDRQLKGWPNLGTARMVCGDSRRLREVIEGADLVVGSPPFSSSINDDNQMKVTGKLAIKRGGTAGGKSSTGLYHGSTPGNLANMKEGDVDCVISSPPYMDSANQGNSQRKFGDPNYDYHSKSDGDNYGHSNGQLGSMKEGSVDLCVSSPPYEDSVSSEKCGIDFLKGKRDGDIRHHSLISSQGKVPFEYGKGKDNLGNVSGDTFWSASKEIVQGCFDILKDNGHAIWVTKRYVKGGKIVEFSDRWLALCESVGFKLVCRHQATLIKEHGVQMTLDNGEEKISTERKSFFRRLAEAKGSPRIDWEDVLCLEKKRV